jgi:hypothetical protein
MKVNMRQLLVILLCLSIFGCASTGKPFKAVESLDQKDKALIYVYHPFDYTCDHHVDPNFLFINDKRVFIFRCNTYTTLSLDPGSYRFAIKTNVFYLPGFEKNGAKIYEFEKNKTYYIRYLEVFAFTDTSTGMPINIIDAKFTKIESDRPPPDIVETLFQEPSSNSF